MGRGKTISLYLVDGDPSGIICSYLSNWTGQSIKIPRNLLDKGKSRPEINRIGVYFLFGYNEENPDEKVVYIGEADNIYKRLVQHAKDENKTFWNEAIAFSSKDDNLTKGHIKYLEYRLINISYNNSNYTLQNKNTASKASLPEMAIADMETFLDNIKVVLPTLGYDLLNEISDKKKTRKNQIYYFEQSNLKAKGLPTNDGFIVLKGSEGNLKIKESLSKGYKNKRENLISKNVIKEENNKLIFCEDYEFSSPSAAAAILVGYAINGRISWRDKTGKTLKHNEEQNLK